MFSFLRKKMDDQSSPGTRASPLIKRAKPAQAERVPVAPVENPAPGAVSPQENNGLHLVKTHAEPQAIGDADSEAVAARELGSVEEEAAVLYACDHSAEGASLLLDFVRNHPGQQNIYPWMMLFDIYQIQGELQQFEELALEFVVKFERSAPIWDATKVPGVKVRKPSAAAPASEGYVSLTGVLKGEQESLFQNILQTAQRGAGLRIDFSRLDGLDASGSQRLMDVMQGLKKSGKTVTPVGVPRLIELLKGLIGQGGEEEPAHWQLLLNLYQCQGLEMEFEDLAVEYAVTFEKSPPSWEAMPPCRQTVTEEETSSFAVVEPHDDDAFYLSGVISAASESQLEALTRFAAGHNEVCLDMADVTRVDFFSVGHFVEMLAILSSGGKKISIRNANEMVRALFSVMEVDKYSTILRRRIA